MTTEALVAIRRPSDASRRAAAELSFSRSTTLRTASLPPAPQLADCSSDSLADIPDGCLGEKDKLILRAACFRDFDDDGPLYLSPGWIIYLDAMPPRFASRKNTHHDEPKEAASAERKAKERNNSRPLVGSHSVVTIASIRPLGITELMKNRIDKWRMVEASDPIE